MKFDTVKEAAKKTANELVSKMSLEEAASQLRYDSPAVESLGVPEYNWWSEGLHGLARGGTATVFPQAIGLAAMFDKELIKKAAEVISIEARAKYNEYAAKEDRDIYKGITLWSPNINIFRDPRWGRGQETFGEDPYLTARLGVEFIKGLQGEDTDDKYMRVAACAKHFAVHSGPEAIRHSFDAIASKKDLEETYLPAFEAAVREADVAGVMGAYNRVNGEPCCGSQTLLSEILRKRWGFDGYIVSDCWAIRDFHENHMVTATPEESAQMALKATCDLNCGIVYLQLLKAYGMGLITEEEIRTAAERLYMIRAELGMFADDCDFDKLNLDDVDTKESKALSLETSLKSMVLLKNDGVLPLDREKIKTVAVIGPTAASVNVLNGNYNGTASHYITNLDGIREAAGEDIRVLYAEGSHLYLDRVQNLGRPDDRISEAVIAAEHSDAVILCVGLDATIEGEEGDTGNAFAAGDKNNLYLPECQRKLIDAVTATGKPVILVINTGSAMDVSSEEKSCNAIIQSWYSGQQGGRALGQLLFGDAVPSAKLPVTVYKEGTLPEFTDYSMKNRTYRYMESEPLYPFGYGLSYTSFSYSDIEVSSADYASVEGAKKAERGAYDPDVLTVKVKVTNTGKYAADEIAELYISKAVKDMAKDQSNSAWLSQLDADNQPKVSLCGFERVNLNPGETKEVSFNVRRSAFETVLEDGTRAVLHGAYTVYAGGQQPGSRSKELTGSDVLSSVITL